MMSLWEQIIEYINLNDIDSIITRKDLMLNYKQNNENTIDNYRRILTVCGFIKVIKRGQYKLVSKIPLESKNLLRDIGYIYLNGKPIS